MGNKNQTNTVFIAVFLTLIPLGQLYWRHESLHVHVRLRQAVPHPQVSPSSITSWSKHYRILTCLGCGDFLPWVGWLFDEMVQAHSLAFPFPHFLHQYQNSRKILRACNKTWLTGDPSSRSAGAPPGRKRQTHWTSETV
jgi:hypothetical protein